MEFIVRNANCCWIILEYSVHTVLHKVPGHTLQNLLLGIPDENFPEAEATFLVADCENMIDYGIW